MSDLLTARQAANRLQLKENTLAKWRHLGKGPPFVKLGSKAVRYHPDRLREWIESTNNLGALREPSRESPCEPSREPDVNSGPEIHLAEVGS